MDSPAVVALTVFALVIGAGALPLLLKPSERVLHAVIAIASGFFLGVTFLHLLPEIAHQSHSVAMWGCVLVGVLAVFFAEVLLRHGDPHQHQHDHSHEHDHPAHHGGHRVVGIASFVGLSVHTLGGAIGIGLSFDPEKAALREALVSATLSHKGAEAFSLVSVLLLSALARRNIVLLLGAYALVTPVGIALGRLFAKSLPQTLLLPAEGLAAGTFLYVAVGELLPEVFHGRKDRGTKVLLLLAGIVGAALLFGEHVHEH